MEILNAISTLAPFIVFLCHLLTHPTQFILASTLAAGLHAPFSFIYHMTKNAKLSFSDDICRKLDLTFIHVSCNILTAAVTTSPIYSAGASFFNLCFISQLHNGQSTAYMRTLNASLAMAAFLLPICLNNIYIFYILALTAITGGILFVYSDILFRGYGHSIFHLLVGVLAHYLVVACA